MSRLTIETTENGFIAYEDYAPARGKQWAFESVTTLTDFIHKWGEDNIKKIPKPGLNKQA